MFSGVIHVSMDTFINIQHRFFFPGLVTRPRRAAGSVQVSSTGKKSRDASSILSENGRASFIYFFQNIVKETTRRVARMNQVHIHRRNDMHSHDGGSGGGGIGEGTAGSTGAGTGGGRINKANRSRLFELNWVVSFRFFKLLVMSSCWRTAVFCCSLHDTCWRVCGRGCVFVCLCQHPTRLCLFCSPMRGKHGCTPYPATVVIDGVARNCVVVDE